MYSVQKHRLVASLAWRVMVNESACDTVGVRQCVGEDAGSGRRLVIGYY